MSSHSRRPRSTRRCALACCRGATTVAARAADFYVRVKFQRVAFPFPPGISTKQYLHKAQLQSSDGGYACASLPFDEEHVIGLMRHQMQTFCQRVTRLFEFCR